MRTSNIIVSLLASSLAVGCAATVPGDPTGGDDDALPPGDDTQPVPLTATGTFAMTETFDLATNMPGSAGKVVNIFIAATDDGDDPTRYIVEQLVNALPDGSVKNNLRDAIPFVAGYLNDRLLGWAPQLVTRVVAIGDGFGQITKNFGTIGTLDIAANGKATHTINGLHFKVDQTELDFPFADYNMSDVKAENIAVTLEKTGKLSIAEHMIPMTYGHALRIGLDEVIIPMIDPDASNLSDVLHNAINCEAVGQKVYDAVGFGSPSTFESACTHGLTAGSAAIYAQINNLDSSAIELGISGVARGVDKNKDGAMDDIQTGTWNGGLTYAGAAAELPSGAKFRGSRMGTTPNP